MEFLKEDNVNIPKLTENEIKSMEGKMTIDELTKVLKNANNNSAPGPSGFTYRFYKVFWNSLKFFLCNSANHSLQQEKLPSILTQGVISLLPKGNKPREYLKNWRPICLLNCGYKLISCVLSNRISKILPSIIHSDQCGFVSGRYIGESLRTTYDVIHHVKSKKLTALLLLLDFEKAFDSVSFRSIIETLKFFKFGEEIICWVKTLLFNFKARINHSGNLSDFFSVDRGARQGDPIASILFVLTIEILAIKIRNSNLIKGIKIGDDEIRAALYADDSNVFLELNEQNLRNAIEILEQFYLFSGLKINMEKCQCIVIGQLPAGDYTLCPDLNLIWKQKFNSLGIDFTSDLSNMDHNFFSKMESVDDSINSWKHRFLSPYGKICIAKTILLSKIAHLALVLPSLTKRQIKTIEDKIYWFIWGGQDKVARVEAKLPERKGGLNGPEISSSWQAFKISWWNRLFKNHDSKWAQILQTTLVEIRTDLSLERLMTKISFDEWTKISQKITNPFWKQCLLAVKPLSREAIKRESEELLKCPIWESSLFLRNNLTCKKSCFRSLSNMVEFPLDMMEKTNSGLRFSTDDELNYKLGQEVEPIETIQLRHIIKESCQKFRLDMSIAQVDFPYKPSILNSLTAPAKGCNYWSKMLKSNLLKKSKIHEKESNWDTRLENIQGPYFWDSFYRFNININFDNRIKWINYQIVRGCLKVNRIISRFKPIQPTCTFCSQNIEDITHLFWECNLVQEFRRYVMNHYNSWPGIRIVTKKECIFGVKTEKTTSPLNLLLFYIKHFIWVNRCKKNLPTLINFNRYFSYEIRIFQKCIEKYPDLNYLLGEEVLEFS